MGSGGKGLVVESADGDGRRWCRAGKRWKRCGNPASRDWHVKFRGYEVPLVGTNLQTGADKGRRPVCMSKYFVHRYAIRLCNAGYVPRFNIPRKPADHVT